MNLRGLKISMLIAFARIYETGSVSKAAQQIAVSQSALSSVLNQLRNYFDDSLFVFDKKIMLPTSRANEIYPTIRAILDNLESLHLNKESFNPLTSTRNFVIAMPDFRASILLPRLIQACENIAPNISFTLKHIANVYSAKFIKEKNIDLTIIKQPPTLALLTYEHILYDWPVIITNKDNPLIQNQDSLALINQSPLALYTKNQFLQTQLGQPLLHELALDQRKIIFNSDTIFPLMQFIRANTNCVSIFLHNIASLMKKDFNLAIRPLPLAAKKCSICFITHNTALHDQGLIWLKQLIKTIIL